MPQIDLFMRFRYDGAGIVERSIALGQPVIYVSMNYRVTGASLGFLVADN